MTIRQLPKSQWQAYFDRVSKGLQTRTAQIEVAALSLGSQVAAKWTPLIGITYDPKDDILEVALESLDHLVHSPRTVSIDESAMGLSSLEVIDGEGRQQIIRLKEPLTLPAPTK
jgi:hypothetical protein